VADYLTFEQTLRQSAAIIAATNQLLNRILRWRTTDRRTTRAVVALTHGCESSAISLPRVPAPRMGSISTRRRSDVEPMMASVREADRLVSREVKCWQAVGS
jgi:hypothetical protein